MHKIDPEEFLMHLDDLRVSVNVMKIGCETVSQEAGAKCLAVTECRLEELIKVYKNSELKDEPVNDKER